MQIRTGQLTGSPTIPIISSILQFPTLKALHTKLIRKDRFVKATFFGHVEPMFSLLYILKLSLGVEFNQQKEGEFKTLVCRLLKHLQRHIAIIVTPLLHVPIGQPTFHRARGMLLQQKQPPPDIAIRKQTFQGYLYFTFNFEIGILLGINRNPINILSFDKA